MSSSPPKEGTIGSVYPQFDGERPLAYHEKPMSYWQRLPYRSDTGGVSPMWLEGRFMRMNQRAAGMTPEDRAYRKQFLHDQILAPHEPVDVPQMYTELFNPIRRFYRWPMVKLEAFLLPRVGRHPTLFVRYTTKYFLWFTAATYWITYYYIYRKNDWTRHGGFEFLWNRPRVMVGEEHYPYVTNRTRGRDYDNRNFVDSPI